MSHTPGPWGWLGEPGSSTLNSAHGEVLGYAAYEGLWPGRFTKDEDLANMSLIAAAPELLSALKMLTYDADGVANCYPTQQHAMKIISKAEGK